MQTPVQSARRRTDAGARLPMPWNSAAGLQVFLRRGQLAMLVAAPGVGKSVVSTAYAVQSGAHVLYQSMDTDAYTTSLRLIAAATGYTVEQAEHARAAEEPWTIDALRGLTNVHFGYPSSPDETEIHHRLLAYREAMGEYPQLLVLDNLSNIAFDDEEFAGLRRVMRDLQTIAGKTGTAILVLHHATGEHENGDKPIPLSGVSGKVSKFPALILSAYRRSSTELGVSVLKNRFGPANPSGSLMFGLTVDMARASVRDGTTSWRGA